MIHMETFDNLLAVLANSRCRVYDMLRALWPASSRMTLDIPLFRRLLSLLPSSNSDLSGHDIMQASVDRLGEPRVEGFILFFSRVADRRGVCSPALLYDPDLGIQQATRSLWRRLGRLVITDAMNVCQRVHSNYIHNKFEMDLATHEGWTLCRMLLKLGAIEDGENIIMCRYSEATYLSSTASVNAGSSDGSRMQLFSFMIPGTWLNNLPRVGTVVFEYVSELEEYILPKTREDLGNAFCGHANFTRRQLTGPYLRAKYAEREEKGKRASRATKG